MAQPRIFVVNDEAPLRMFLSFNLKARGFEVIDTISSPDVFSAIEKAQPDLVILDLMACGTDGFELFQQIRNSLTSSVIVINMRGGEADLIRCLEIGADDYIGKPFGADELLARVGAVLRHKRWTKSLEPVNL